MKLLADIYRVIYWKFNTNKFIDECEQLVKEAYKLDELSRFSVADRKALVTLWMYSRLPDNLTRAEKKKESIFFLMYAQAFLHNQVYNPERVYPEIMDFKQWVKTLDGKNTRIEILHRLNN